MRFAGAGGSTCWGEGRRGQNWQCEGGSEGRPRPGKGAQIQGDPMEPQGLYTAKGASYLRFT